MNGSAVQPFNDCQGPGGAKILKFDMFTSGSKTAFVARDHSVIVQDKLNI